MEYDFWYSNIFDLDQRLLADIGTFQRILGKGALFTPRLYTYNCSDCNEDIKSTFCEDNGNFCFWAPDSKIPPNLKSFEESFIVRQAIKIRCSYEVVSENPNEYNYT